MSVRAGGAEEMFLNVKEHLFCASGAYAHALPLFSRPCAKSRNGLSSMCVFAPSLTPPRSSTRAGRVHRGLSGPLQKARQGICPFAFFVRTNLAIGSVTPRQGLLAAPLG